MCVANMLLKKTVYTFFYKQPLLSCLHFDHNFGILKLLRQLLTPQMLKLDIFAKILLYPPYQFIPNVCDNKVRKCLTFAEGYTEGYSTGSNFRQHWV